MVPEVQNHNGIVYHRTSALWKLKSHLHFAVKNTVKTVDLEYVCM